jgi:hypothetical protein
MKSYLVVVNGMVHEVEEGKLVKPRGTDALELECECLGNACDDIRIEYPGAGFIIRNGGGRRIRVRLRVLSGWDCTPWTNFDLDPGESRRYLTGGYCCPYDANYA